MSHLYLSPILTAAEGSTHGYDVTDPTTISAELGGPEGFSSLVATAKAAGLGVIVDIVPNHVGVDVPRQNAWWWDLLTHGRDSAYASYFDVDWSLDPDGRIVLPVLAPTTTSPIWSSTGTRCASVTWRIRSAPVPPTTAPQGRRCTTGSTTS